MISADLCLARLAAVSANDAIRALAGKLLAKGNVRPSFEAAALARERRSPTGLPFAPVAVAIPHAEPEHVLVPAVALASLAAPVRFRQMGSPRVELEVSLVLMPALGAKEQTAAGLTQLMELLQNAALREALAAAPSPEALHATLAARWGT